MIVSDESQDQIVKPIKAAWPNWQAMSHTVLLQLPWRTGSYHKMMDLCHWGFRTQTKPAKVDEKSTEVQIQHIKLLHWCLVLNSPLACNGYMTKLFLLHYMQIPFWSVNLIPMSTIKVITRAAKNYIPIEIPHWNGFIWFSHQHFCKHFDTTLWISFPCWGM